ncbi:hypothetical protein BASA81_001132 [Batrachochytrium salamandrivorans]|nr:hypothetical protein BASA81_001132 [Batrachochytrium salamandrivorans]
MSERLGLLVALGFLKVLNMEYCLLPIATGKNRVSWMSSTTKKSGLVSVNILANDALEHFTGWGLGHYAVGFVTELLHHTTEFQ